MHYLLAFLQELPGLENLSTYPFFSWLGQAAAALVALGVLWNYLGKPIYQAVRKIATMYDRVEDLVKQMERNGGGSVRDSLDRIERTVFLLDERQKILLGLVPYALVETDDHGRVTWVNRTYLVWTGREEHEILKDGWVNVIHPDDQKMVRQDWIEAIQEKRAYEGHFRMIGAHGKVFIALAKAVPMFGERSETEPLGWLAILQRCDNVDCVNSGACVFPGGSTLCPQKT